MAVWKIKEIYNLQRSNDWIPKGNICVFAGGYTSSNVNTIDFVSAAAGGTAADFGDLTAARGTMQDNYGTQTRGIFAGGANLNTIDYVTIATTGNAADFGDLTQARRYVAGGGNATRGIYGGGISSNPSNGHYNIIEFLTGASLGNAADFGDLTQTLERLCSLSSPTRQVWAAGAVPGDTVQNTIQSVQTATTGNATDFGDLSVGKYGPMGVSNGIRGLVCGGNAGAPGHASFNHIESITFATAANSTDFGDLSGTYLASGSASAGTGATRGLVGHNSPATGLDKIEISTGGNGVDFADVSVARGGYAGVSNGHGGLDLDDVQRPSVTYMPGSGRGIFMGGRSPTLSTVVHMNHIPSLGNSSDFGDLITAMRSMSNASSLTRALSAAGYGSDYTNTIESIEFASEGNAADFGNLTVSAYDPQNGNVGNTTRGIFAGGHVSPTQNDTIGYVTIATAGNASDFGNLGTGRQSMGGISNNTRGVFCGGTESDPTGAVDKMEYITIASTGNTSDFGDLSADRTESTGFSSSTRGIVSGGQEHPTSYNIIEYITIASTGNMTDFGDLSSARYDLAAVSNSTRGVSGGGAAPGVSNVLDYVTIASTGNAADFGDLVAVRRGLVGNSDSHGGVQA